MQPENKNNADAVKNGFGLLCLLFRSKNVQKTRPGIIIDNIRSLLHLAALPTLPDERLVIRFFYCGVSSNSSELTLSSEDVFPMLS